MVPITYAGYEFTFRKASNDIPERDAKIKRAENQTEIFSILGNFNKITDGEKFYVKITIDGGAEEYKTGKWIDYETVGHSKDELFYYGLRPLSKDANNLKITIDVGGNVVGQLSYEID